MFTLERKPEETLHGVAGVTVRRERCWTSAGATPPGTGSLNPVAIETIVEATKLSELSMERVARRLREQAGRNVNERLSRPRNSNRRSRPDC